MAIQVWNGSAYVDANLPRADASNVPKNAYIWNGSAYVRVWPTKAVFVEGFNSNAGNVQWDNFTGINQVGGPQMGSNRAGMRSIGVTGGYKSESLYTRNGLLSDSHYCEVILASPIYGVLDTGSSGEYLGIIMRSNGTFNNGLAVLFGIRPGAAYIQTSNGSTYTTRANPASTFTAGQTVRFVTRTDGYCAIYNMTNSPTTPVASWSDGGKTILTYSASSRNLIMHQGNNYPIAQSQFTSFAVDQLTYGDL